MSRLNDEVAPAVVTGRLGRADERGAEAGIGRSSSRAGGDATPPKPARAGAARPVGRGSSFDGNNSLGEAQGVWPGYPGVPHRTLANAAAVEGFFAFAWFGWGQEGPPAAVSIVLAVGALLAALVAAGGIVSAYRARRAPSPLRGRDARLYAIIVGTEFGLAGLGAAVLAGTGRYEFIPAWVCLVVGGHLVPLSRVFPRIGLVVVGAAVSLVGAAAVGVGATTEVLPSTLTGLGAGTCLLGHAASMLAVTLSRRAPDIHAADPASARARTTGRRHPRGRSLDLSDEGADL